MILRESSSNTNASYKETLDNLPSAFSDVLSALQQCSARAAVSRTTVAKNVCPRLKSGEPGKPAFDISAELLEDLLGLGFTYTRIAQMLEVTSLDYIKNLIHPNLYLVENIITNLRHKVYACQVKCYGRQY